MRKLDHIPREVIWLKLLAAFERPLIQGHISSQSRALGYSYGCQGNVRMFPVSFMLLLDFTITEGVLVGEIWTRCTLMSILTEVLAIGVLVLYLTEYYCIELVSIYFGRCPWLQ